MKRTTTNFLVDALAFIAMLFLCSTGLVLAHQLPPGSGSALGRGTGHGAADKSVSLLWGLSRHEWGDIHYWIAYALLALLAVHIVLHWKWIVCVTRGRPTDASPRRLLVGAVSLVFLLILTITPLLTSTTTVRRGDLDRPAPGRESVESPAAKASETETTSTQVSIRGSMSFQEIADAAGIPVDEVIRKAGLPSSTLPADRAGRTLHSYGKEMSDLRSDLGLPEVHETNPPAND